MYKLVIVDDEAIVLRELSAFNWKEIGIELVGAYDNAILAYEAVANNSVDILLTDITMPMMDGLTLIRQIRKLRASITFVVLSGFAEYEYMRESINLSVNDYILKPIDYSELRLAFTEIVTAKQKLSRQEEKLLRLKETIENYRSKFFTKLFTRSVSREELSEKCDLCEINLTDDPIDLCLFRFDRLTQTADYGSVKFSDMLYFVQKSVSSFLEENSKGFAFYDGVSDCFAAAFIPATQDTMETEALIDGVREYISGLGSLFEDSVSAVYVKNADTPTELWQYIKQMKAVFSPDWEEETREYVCGKIEAPSVSYTREDTAEYKSGHQTETVEKMIAYVNENYNKPIRLKDVAAEVYISHTYAGHIFNSVTGKHFVEYLVELRMQKAKELLLKTNTPVNLIGEEIGYADPSYFCQVFKREEGVSPREYRQNAQR